MGWLFFLPNPADGPSYHKNKKKKEGGEWRNAPEKWRTRLRKIGRRRTGNESRPVAELKNKSYLCVFN
jgi:hypothetical protein